MRAHGLLEAHIIFSGLGPIFLYQPVRFHLHFGITHFAFHSLPRGKTVNSSSTEETPAEQAQFAASVLFLPVPSPPLPYSRSSSSRSPRPRALPRSSASAARDFGRRRGRWQAWERRCTRWGSGSGRPARPSTASAAACRANTSSTSRVSAAAPPPHPVSPRITLPCPSIAQEICAWSGFRQP